RLRAHRREVAGVRQELQLAALLHHHEHRPAPGAGRRQLEPVAGGLVALLLELRAEEEVGDQVHVGAGHAEPALQLPGHVHRPLPPSPPWSPPRPPSRCPPSFPARPSPPSPPTSPPPAAARSSPAASRSRPR